MCLLFGAAMGKKNVSLFTFVFVLFSVSCRFFSVFRFWLLAGVVRFRIRLRQRTAVVDDMCACTKTDRR